jgi:HEAT repeat protein
LATLDTLRQELDKDELDYPALASRFGADALPQLQQLVAEDEPRIASKAAYLAGLIDGADVVDLAAGSRHDVVRVSAAAAMALLPPDRTPDIAERLLSDADPGIRARAVKSAARIRNPRVAELVRTLAANDPEDHVRELATRVARDLPS